jgi:hypothetical protein
MTWWLPGPWSVTRRRVLFELTLTHFRAPDLEINLTSSATNQQARGSIGSPTLVAYLCPVSPCCEDALRRVKELSSPVQAGSRRIDHLQGSPAAMPHGTEQARDL